MAAAAALSLALAASCQLRAPVGYSVEAEATPLSGALKSRILAAEAETVQAASRLGMAISDQPGVKVSLRVEPLQGGSSATGPAIALDRAYLVPVAAPGSGRWNAALASCMEGRESLSAHDEVPEDMYALRVDGLAIDDPGYPLAVEVSATIRAPGPRRAQRAATALSKALAAAAKPQAAAPSVFWMAAAGDMMLGRGSAGLWAAEGSVGLLGGAAAILAEADCAVVNLEGAITARGTKAAKAYNFRFPRQVAGLLADAGIDAVLLSNNHALDYGLTGLLDTLEALSSAGIGALGAGRNLEEAVRPFAVGGARLYGLSSYPVERSGWSGADKAAAPGRPGIARSEGGGADRLSAGFTSGAVDAVFVHGGQEWSSAPDSATTALFRGLVDRGADAVFGSHPHVSQGWELYRGRVIFWSLGNFVFPGMEGTPGGERGLLAQVGFCGERPLYVRAVPLRLRSTRVGLAEGAR